MVTIAINGFGRIGKQFLLAALERKVSWKFVINHPDSLDHIVYAIKYDTVHPTLKKVSHNNKQLIIGNKKINVYHELDPSKAPWKKEKVDLVVEASGLFRKKKDASKHLQAGAKKVLISAPSKDPDCTIGFGVNNSTYKKSHKIISAASCTTNCLIQLAKVLHDNFQIKNAEFITTHAYTSTQHLIDGDDRKDMRRGRAAALNIVPTSSGAATSTCVILPELKGKISGYALRVPVIDGSITNLYAQVKKPVDVKKINTAFKKASKKLKGILQYTSDPIVSSDIIHNPNSCIFDSQLTQVSGSLVSIAGWYDNEWGYANRLVDMVILILKK
jgi:glyceraldehyde 3-phosphate dehydrogenase